MLYLNCEEYKLNLFTSAFGNFKIQMSLENATVKNE